MLSAASDIGLGQEAGQRSCLGLTTGSERRLTRELGGHHPACRGAYRVIYRIDEIKRIVHIVRIDRRADVCRTR
jgi:hypothetical protein